MVECPMTTNSEMEQLWNSEASAAWSSHHERYDAMLCGLGEHVLQAAALTVGERVLDVGCGAGQLAIQAAERVGTAGSVLGVDLASELVGLATRRAAELGVSQAGFLRADAQVHAFPAGAYDVVLSRFGVMFFADPVEAFTNLLAATAPGGRLAFVAWQAAPYNEWVTVPLMAMVPHVGPPTLPPPDAPGPFAFGDAERVRAVLTDAGWAQIAVEDVQTVVSVGGAPTAEDAVQFIVGDTFGRMLLSQASPEQRSAAVTALRQAYEGHVTEGEVRVKAAAWLVTARRPQ